MMDRVRPALGRRALPRHASVRLPRAALLAFSAALPGCGGEPVSRSAARPPLVDSPISGASASSDGAVYRYHPASPGTPLARVELADGRILYTARGGERWLVDPKKAAAAETTADLAPEEMVAIVQKGNGFLFVGRSGTSYAAETPLGPFTRSAAPLERLVRVRAAASSLVGIRHDGALVQSPDAGTTWSRVGPSSSRFEDIAVGPDGRGLALAVPEALYETRDFGASWSPLAVPTLGMSGFVDDIGARVIARTALGSFLYEPGKTPAFAALDRAESGVVPSIGKAAPLGPSASALADGRAILAGDRYFEVRPEHGRFLLVSGTFGSPLDGPLLDVPRGTADVRIAGFDRTLYLASVRDKKETLTQEIVFQRSIDAGRTWKTEPYVAWGRSGELSMAVGEKGNLLVSGICPESPVKAHGEGCIPMGVHLRKEIDADSGPVLTLVPVATPSLVRSALGLAFSLDGRTAYAIGQHTKGESLAAFVSKDGGETFEAHEIDALTVPDESEVRSRLRASDFDVESLAPGEDGTMAVVIKQRSVRTWLVVDPDGHASALAKPPADSDRLGAAGQRGIALNRQSRDAYESEDAGATWNFIGKLPVAPCSTNGECTEVDCIARGCVFGEVLSRIGWGGRISAQALSPSSADRPRIVPRTSTPLICTLEPAEWKRLSGVVAPPSAAQSAVGRADFWVAREDPTTSAVSTLHAKPGSPLRFEEATLLAPLSGPPDRAYRSVNQVEGLAAVRYKIPSGSPSKDGDLHDVELAWDDALDGKVGSAKIADGGPVKPNDYDGRGPFRNARPELVSIAEGGLYVRLHQSPGVAEATYFADGRTIEIVPPVAWPAGGGAAAEEMVHAGRFHVPVRILGTTIERAVGAPHGWTFDARSLGYADPAEFDRAELTDIAYANGRSGFVVTTEDLAGTEATALLYPFRADGPVVDAPIALPTQLALGPNPHACTPTERTSTPRVVASYQPGTRRPVLVSDAVEPRRVMLTDEAVLYGTPAAPCAAAYDATAVSWELSTTAPKERALILMNNLERSFLFRMADVPAGARTALEYRTMSCRADPKAEVPVEIYREKGTLLDAR